MSGSVVVLDTAAAGSRCSLLEGIDYNLAVVSIGYCTGFHNRLEGTRILVGHHNSVDCHNLACDRRHMTARLD